MMSIPVFVAIDYMICGRAASSPLRAVHASSQASPAAGASAVSLADAPPVGAWNCEREGGGLLSFADA